MDWNKVAQLVPTPREPDEKLTQVVGHDSFVAGLGFYSYLVALLCAVLFTALAAFGVTSWLWLLSAPVFFAIGFVITHATRDIARKSARERASRLPITVAGVVQASSRLWEPEGAYAGAVLTFSTDPKHALDAEWLNVVLKRIEALRTGHAFDPSCVALVAALSDSRSMIDMALPAAVSDGVPSRIYATSIDAQKFASKRIPDHRMLAVIVDDGRVPTVLPGALWE